MILILNVIWLVFFGLPLAIGWFIAGFVMIVTIIGIPWAGAAWRTAAYALWPFGRTALSATELDAGDWEAGGGGVLANLVWIVFAGWWLALGHLGAALGLGLTIVGIPMAWVHLKLARQAFAPVGRRVARRSDLRLDLA